jgi:phosphate transport system protein
MARVVLDKELQELDAQIVRLGSLVDEALALALEALESGDLAKAGMVIEGDTIMTSTLSIAGDLERTGDGAAGIAQIILRMAPLRSSNMPQVNIELIPAGADTQITETSILNSMLELGQEARRVLQGTMEAFANRDAKAARYIWEEDDVVDVRYHLVRHDLMAMLEGARAIPALQNDARILQRATYLLWIAHKLERIGDHCTNVCERIVFIVEGETSMKHSQ